MDNPFLPSSRGKDKKAVGGAKAKRGKGGLPTSASWALVEEEEEPGPPDAPSHAIPVAPGGSAVAAAPFSAVTPAPPVFFPPPISALPRPVAVSPQVSSNTVPAFAQPPIHPAATSVAAAPVADVHDPVSAAPVPAAPGSRASLAPENPFEPARIVPKKSKAKKTVGVTSAPRADQPTVPLESVPPFLPAPFPFAPTAGAAPPPTWGLTAPSLSAAPPPLPPSGPVPGFPQEPLLGVSLPTAQPPHVASAADAIAERSAGVAGAPPAVAFSFGFSIGAPSKSPSSKHRKGPSKAAKLQPGADSGREAPRSAGILPPAQPHPLFSAAPPLLPPTHQVDATLLWPPVNVGSQAAVPPGAGPLMQPLQGVGLHVAQSYAGSLAEAEAKARQTAAKAVQDAHGKEITAILDAARTMYDAEDFAGWVRD